MRRSDRAAVDRLAEKYFSQGKDAEEIIRNIAKMLHLTHAEVRNRLVVVKRGEEALEKLKRESRRGKDK